MNITDEYRELLTSIVNHDVGGSSRVQVKEIRLDEDADGEKLLTAAFDVETLNGHDELIAVTTASRHILRDDNSGISRYFRMFAEATKKKVAELYETTTEIVAWISCHYPTVSGALQAYSAMGGTYRTEYMGCAKDAECPVMVTLDPAGDCVPLILRVPKGTNRMHEMVALSSIVRHIERRNKPSVS